MINLRQVHSVTDFQRNPKKILGQLEETHAPAVLTVNGKAKFVVQDAESYQLLLDKVQASEDLEEIRQGLNEALTGKGRLADEFFAEFEAEHDL